MWDFTRIFLKFNLYTPNLLQNPLITSKAPPVSKVIGNFPPTEIVRCVLQIISNGGLVYLRGGCFLYLGAGASVCPFASIVVILVCILPLVLVLWESAPLVLVLHIGPVLITATPAVPFFCNIRTSKSVSQAFRFQCFICTFG